jgi:hypothetical protein
MSKVFSAHAVSVNGYISGRTPDGAEEFGRGLGDAPMLFDWYSCVCWKSSRRPA